jgi:hypothetical protein
MRHSFHTVAAAIWTAVAAASSPFPALAQAQKIGAPPEARDMRLVGWSDLQARSAYQPTIHEQNGRWIAYIGHHGGTDAIKKPRNPMTGADEDNGTSVLDVTDPANPKYLVHIPGEPGTYEQGGAQMVRVCDGRTLPKGDPAKTYMLRTFGNRAHEIWDVSDPARPTRLVSIPAGKGTHKNWWECDTGIAFLVSGIEGWAVRRMTQVYDLSDPAKPVHLRDFGLPGQQPGAAKAANAPSSGGGHDHGNLVEGVPTELHGPISTGPAGNRVYLGYGTNKGGIVQIVDRKKLLEGPKEPTPENLAAPQVGRLDLSSLVGAHTTFPLGRMKIAEFARDKAGAERDMILVVNESLVNECQEARQMVWLVDATVESRPMVVSSWTVPEASGRFCERGGRFGAHSSNESFAPVFYQKLVFIAFFNAGVRALDIRDPFHPKEVAYFIPAIAEATDKRCLKVGEQERCKTAIQTNNVEIDARGYVYIVDRANTGLHILELTGEARRIAGLN